MIFISLPRKKSNELKVPAVLVITGIVFIILTGCVKQPVNITPPVGNIVTSDIQAGIENHIEEQIQTGNGYFNLPFDDEELHLKLVRVHTEYLANLGPRRHFACVDLVDTSGDVYDVDFFLAGEPGAMKVTETSVHKINGQPYYAWKQKPDKTWHRIAVDKASHHQFGVIKGQDEFEFLYQATLPEIGHSARMWIPLPANDSFQTVVIKYNSLPGKKSELKDLEYENRILFIELGPEDSEKKIDLRFFVKRLEKSIYPAQKTDYGKYLKPERLVPTNENFKKIAKEVVKNKKSDLVRARALYDHVIDQMRYMKYGAGWGKGDAVYACDIRTGNCTDFHSYFIALARAVNIPARFAIGAAIPSERNEGGVDGYHCWAEFYADGNWWPVDISEADKYTSLATYYFGHHPANRIEFSRGRDLIVKPSPESGPINFLAYPILEIDGKTAKAKAEFSFNRIFHGEDLNN